MKPYQAVYKELVYLMYSSRLYGIQSQRNINIRNNATTIKISNTISYMFMILLSAFLSYFFKNPGIGFSYLAFAIFVYVISIGINVVYNASNYDLRTLLLSLPLDEKEATYAITRGIMDFFLLGLAISVIFPPIISFLLTHNVIVALQVLLEMIFGVAGAIAIMFYLGRKTKLGIVSSFARILPFVVYLLLFSIPGLFTGNVISHRLVLPIAYLPVFPFAFSNILSIPFSFIYTGIVVFLGFKSVMGFTAPRIESSKIEPYKIGIRGPVFSFISKDFKTITRVPQAGFLLSAPFITLMIAFFDRPAAVSYDIFLFSAGTVSLVVLEMRGFSLLLQIPGAVRDSFISKIVLSSAVYLITAFILLFFGQFLPAIAVFPAVVAGTEISLIISYRSILSGRGLRLTNPISYFIRLIEVIIIPLIAYALYFYYPIYSLVFSIISLASVTYISAKMLSKY
ncbi:hypothetical protein HS7_04060 [Sulfolobales archaeon HS-7]|nr:hypothetical protein HS7_04060 [Sulfolobales archaeon HS-7]